MRIIAGSHKGRKINGPDNNLIRPTMDRAKEGIFNVINMDIIDSNVLDLFSGTGNLGIEAKSRGASEVVSVDNSKEAINLIKENLKNLNMEIDVIQRDVEDYLKQTAKKFDIIFLDPPYDIDPKKLVEILKKAIIALDKEGYLVLEMDAKINLDLNGFNVFKEKKYGISRFYFVSSNE